MARRLNSGAWPTAATKAGSVALRAKNSRGAYPARLKLFTMSAASRASPKAIQASACAACAFATCKLKSVVEPRYASISPAAKPWLSAAARAASAISRLQLVAREDKEGPEALRLRQLEHAHAVGG